MHTSHSQQSELRKDRNPKHLHHLIGKNRQERQRYHPALLDYIRIVLKKKERLNHISANKTPFSFINVTNSERDQVRVVTKAYSRIFLRKRSLDYLSINLLHMVIIFIHACHKLNS